MVKTNPAHYSVEDRDGEILEGDMTPADFVEVL
jgi:hypothetical protein